MTPPQATSSFWRTSSFGHHADTQPPELTMLSQHLSLCRHANGMLFAMKCHGEALRQFMSARLVTTLIVGLILIGGTASAML